MDRHIAELKGSAEAALAATGRVLEAAKKGFAIGYVAPVIAIAVGQMLLGNPLGAIAGATMMAISPIAMTCGAIGAIWMGWNALTDAEREAILSRAATGLNLARQVILSVVELVLASSRELFETKPMQAVIDAVRGQAKVFGGSLYSVTGKFADYVMDMLPRKLPTPEGGDEALLEVLQAMDRSELLAIARGPLQCNDNLEPFDDSALRIKVGDLISEAAAHSLPGAEQPSYPDVVAMVAKRLDLPTPSAVHVREVERVILFKVVELSLEKMNDEQKEALVANVDRELRERGVTGHVAFQEIVKFVKFGGLDVGGTLGGLVMAGPGAYGIVGLNFLQFIILKGIILTSGYFAAGIALLGLGWGGLLMTIGGAAGPIGAGLAVLYAAYTNPGPLSEGWYQLCVSSQGSA